MSAHGRLLGQARVTLLERAECLVGLLDRRIVGRRCFLRLSMGLHDRPAVDELVRCVSDHLLITKIWIGEGELSFPEAYGEELEVLGPLKVGADIGLVLLFRHRYRDPGRPDRLAIASDANKRVLDFGRNEQVDAFQSNQLWLVLVASLPKVMHQDTGMLKGFTVPKSPFGQAALTPPPPWHYAGDAVGVEFWTDPDAMAATLPNGLSRDPKSNGHTVMMFLDWQFTARDDEYLDPARYQYREAFIVVDAMYRDVPVMWCPYIYVDNDAALACGWTRGFPKKIGSMFQMRYFVASGPAAAPVASSSRFGASLSAHGQRLAEACVSMRKPVENGMSLLSRPAVLLRYFPRLAADTRTSVR
jgi:hypothetical protein